VTPGEGNGHGGIQMTVTYGIMKKDAEYTEP